jgi:Trk K+ transport system NAD-binding subunit
MSILLIEPPTGPGTAVVKRLISQGDEVRVVDRSGSERWKEIGAHVARGESTDADLLERAGQHCRTVVLFDPHEDATKTAVEAAKAARIERLIVCCTRSIPRLIETLRSSGLEYVVLTSATRGLRRKLSGTSIAQAVDAADDISGHGVRLELDLSRPESWRKLGLTVSS